MRFLKVILVSLAGVGAAWITNFLLGKASIQLGSASTFALYAIVASVFLYFPVPKRSLSVRGKKVEYILTGQGQLTDKLFNLASYSDYSVVESNSEGRILADPSGKIICTRYVSPGQISNGMSRIHLIFLCLISVSLSIMIEYLIPLIQAGRLNLAAIRLRNHLAWISPEALFPRIRNNILSLIKTLSSIEVNLDFRRCFEIIKENLERLAILQFN